MAWLLVLILAVLLTTVSLAFVLAPTRTFKSRAIAAAAALAIVVLLGALFWKQAVVALAISTVCSLAVGVMFQRVSPSKAIGGALAAFALFFPFSWLAIQLSEPLFFDRPSELSRWWATLWEHRWGELDSDASGWLAAIGLACLVAGAFLDRWLRAAAVFLGVVLLCVYGPMALRRSDFVPWDWLRHADSPLQAVFVGAFLAIVVALARAVYLRISKHP